MRHNVPLALPLAVLAAGALPAACASTPSPGPASYSMGSGYSGSSSDDRPSGATGVRMAQEEAGLVVRPDTLVMDVRVQEEDPNAGQALARAQAATAELTARLQQATGGAATVTPCGTQVTPLGGRGKMAGPTEAFQVEIEGRVEIALAPALDYWKRSALLVALAEVTGSYERARRDKTAGAPGVWLSHMRVVVRDPESFRGKLTEQWVQRTRAFATAAQAHEAPLYLMDCAPPGDIVQKQQSLEEVALSLLVSCRLGSTKGPAAVLPPPR